MRDMLVSALKSYYVGKINKHLSNIEIYLRQPVGVGEHSDIVEAIQKELDTMAQANDRIEMIETFEDGTAYNGPRAV